MTNPTTELWGYICTLLDSAGSRQEQDQLAQTALQSLSSTFSRVPLKAHSDPALLLSNSGEHSSLARLKEHMQQADDVFFASAFYSRWMTNQLHLPLDRLRRDKKRFRLITSTMGHLISPQQLRGIRSSFPSTEVRLFHPPEVPWDQNPPAFHVKLYLFRHGTTGTLWIGSSNFSQGGFGRNIESVYFSSGEVCIPFAGKNSFEEAWEFLEDIWDNRSVEPSDDYIEAYAARRPPEIDRLNEPLIGLHSAPPPYGTPVPNSIQLEALTNLQATRKVDKAKRAAVIAATGLGKTYLAAFDAQQFDAKRILFISHRYEILTKSLETFRAVFGGEFRGEVLSGGKATPHNPSVFAMIQTLCGRIHEYPPDHFDYVVVDEFHHASAKSYNEIFEYLQPEFLLGLTATPERSDGRDVLALCNHVVAYEVRLFEAIERGWLTPFNYFAFPDTVDYSSLKWTGTDFNLSELEEALSTDTRSALLAHNLRRYQASTGKCKALVFCASVNHAQYTAQQLSEAHKIPSSCVFGETSLNEREARIRDLQDENHPLEVITAVDVFNEGVDIPRLSHIALMRPTVSFTIFLQQLGRGLRKSPNKDFLVVLDLIGNHKKAYVPHIALQGFTSVEDYRSSFKASGPSPDHILPGVCTLDLHSELEQITQSQLQATLNKNKSWNDRLDEAFEEIQATAEPGETPQFEISSYLHTAFESMVTRFSRQQNGWIRVLASRGHQIPEKYSQIMDTPGEELLYHLETELKPNKCYKMVVLQSLLKMDTPPWDIDEIASRFLNFFLHRPEYIFDYKDLDKFSEQKRNYPLTRVRSHLIAKPLRYLSNTDKKPFSLDKKENLFGLASKYIPYWNNPDFKEMVQDRVDFALGLYWKKIRQTRKETLPGR